MNRRSEGDEDKDEDDVEDRLARWRSSAHAKDIFVRIIRGQTKGVWTCRLD